jgi:hypothetical protein
MQAGELPEALAEMETLLTLMQKEGAPQKRIDEVRANVGTASYYAAWLMRLEGAAREEWTAEAENARQHFRLLSEEHLKADPRRPRCTRRILKPRSGSRGWISPSCKACRCRRTARAAKT